ncbi:unnamed protein product, partial [Protopolystoma xenopodis]
MQKRLTIPTESLTQRIVIIFRTIRQRFFCTCLVLSSDADECSAEERRCSLSLSLTILKRPPTPKNDASRATCRRWSSLR